MTPATIDREQERLFKDLLPVLDALDQACLHWQEAQSLYQLDRSPPESDSSPPPAPELSSETIISQPAHAAQDSVPVPKTFWQTLWDILQTPVWPRPPRPSLASEQSAVQQTLQDALQQIIEADLGEEPETSEPDPEESSWAEILQSGQEGVELIRQMTLDVLKQRKVIPLNAEGKPFDGKYMVALARDTETDYPANTVTQEVVKGYLWGDRILREAQVIVAASKAS